MCAGRSRSLSIVFGTWTTRMRAARALLELHRRERRVVAADRDELRDVEPQQRRDRACSSSCGVRGRIGARDAEMRAAAEMNAADRIDGQRRRRVRCRRCISHSKPSRMPDDVERLRAGARIVARADDAVDAGSRAAADEDGEAPVTFHTEPPSCIPRSHGPAACIGLYFAASIRARRLVHCRERRNSHRKNRENLEVTSDPCCRPRALLRRDVQHTSPPWITSIRADLETATRRSSGSITRHSASRRTPGFGSRARHTAALAHVTHALERREPVVVVTGEIGTGKTLLCRTVVERLERKTFLSIVTDPLLEHDDLLKQMLQDFGVISKDRTRLTPASRHDLVHALQQFLSSLASLNAHAVVIIDEAQHLKPDMLESIRLVSNIQDERGTMLQIILVGQTDLDQLVSRPELRALKQRVSRIRSARRADAGRSRTCTSTIG